MGYDTRTFTIFGIKTEWDSGFADVLDEKDYDEENIGIEFVADGLSGNYMVFGKVLYKGQGSRWGDDKDADYFVSISLEDLPEIEEAYRKKFLELYPELSHIMEGKFQIHTLEHTT